MCSLAADGAPFLAEPSSDLEAQQKKEQRGKEKLTVVWMLTMSLLWLGGFWACVWTQAPHVGRATSFEQEWRAVKGLLGFLERFFGEMRRRLGNTPWAEIFLLVLFFNPSSILMMLVVWKFKKSMTCVTDSAPGVFVRHRVLPLLDIGSDIAITYRLWGTDHWLSRLSLFFIGNSFMATFVLAAPVFQAVLAQKGVRQPLALWTIVGLPCSALVGPVSMVLYPCRDVDLGWLAKVLRLQKVVAVLLEAPAQALLQFWMVLARVALAMEEGHEQRKFPIMLVASFCLSLLNIQDTMEDTRATAKTQDMGFFEALWEELLMSLNRRAPLLPVMRFQTRVSWAGEGPLTEEHCKQIAQQLHQSPNLRALAFAHDNAVNGLSASHLVKAKFQVFEEKGQEVELQGLDHTLRLVMDGDIESLKDQSAEGVEILAIRVGEDTRPEIWSSLAGFTGIKFFMLANGRYVKNMKVHCEPIVEHIAKCRGFQRFVVCNDMDWRGDVFLRKAAARQGFQLEGVAPERLVIPFHSGLGPEGCSELAALPSLQHLSIGCGNNVGAQGCRVLAALPYLRHFQIYSSGNDVSRRDLEAFPCKVKFINL